MNLLSELVKANFHIHTHFSTCAAANMTVPNLLAQAKKAGLEKIALVDHDHDQTENLLYNIEKIEKEVKKYKPGIKVSVGAELSAFGVDKIGVT
jgi:histidinol phosphatase-like PHP family hydrolase